MFLCTCDENTKNILLKEGFKLVEEGNGFWKFINEPNKTFSKNIANDKITYSNTLCI